MERQYRLVSEMRRWTGYVVCTLLTILNFLIIGIPIIEVIVGFITYFFIRSIKESTLALIIGCFISVIIITLANYPSVVYAGNILSLLLGFGYQWFILPMIWFFLFFVSGIAGILLSSIPFSKRK